MKTQNLTFLTQTCTCCNTPQALTPRDDLPGGLAVCQQSGQLYRPEGNTFIPTTMPTLRPEGDDAAAVQVDLSRYGYA